MVTPPELEPVNFAEAKAHLRLDTNTDDACVSALIRAARERVELFLRRTPITQEFEYTIDGFPAGEIDLPRPPLQSIEWIKYVDTAGILQTWRVPADASIRELRSVSAAQILEAEPDYATNSDTIARSFPNLGITVDGYVFSKKPAEIFAAGGEHRIPLLLGNNAREQIPSVALPKDLAKAIMEDYGPIAGRAKELYVGKADPQYGTPIEQRGTDTSFRCSSVAQLAWHAAAGNPAFEYELARIPVGRKAVGSTHGSEITSVFGTLDLGIWGFGPQVMPSDIDRRISDMMQQYWTNFAKTGDPNGKGLPVWPKFDTSSRAYIQFTDSGPVAKQGLRRPYCDLFIENVNRLMKK